MKVTITIEGKQGEGKTTVARALQDMFDELDLTVASANSERFNMYLFDDGTIERRTSNQFPHSVFITTIQTDEV